MHKELTDCDSLGVLVVSTVICTGSEGPFNKEKFCIMSYSIDTD